MGRVKLGRHLSRKHVTRIADAYKQKAEERAGVITQALMYNAALHKSLQHELCACTHGASKHMEAEVIRAADAPGMVQKWDLDHPCLEVGCDCKGFKSSWQTSFDAWSTECWAYLDREHHVDKYAPVFTEDPMHELRMVEAFDGGIKAEAHALAKAKILKALAENQAEAEVSDARQD